METGVPETYTQVKFFMGANTPGGFTAYLDDLYEKNGEWRVFLIKSGPGTGKASLMRKVRDHMLAKDIDGISILCSSDPDSLDGLIFPSIKACILDATAPHERRANAHKKSLTQVIRDFSAHFNILLPHATLANLCLLLRAGVIY